LQIFQRFGVSLLPSLGLQPFPAPEGFVVEPMTSGAHFGGRTHGDLESKEPMESMESMEGNRQEKNGRFLVDDF
jgi:hypothetical protein